MKKIGITGGVGSGKSTVMDILSHNCDCIFLRADDIAANLKKKGESCYEPIVELLSENVLDESGEISNAKMAEMVFKDPLLLSRADAIIHPAVKQYIIDEIAKAEEAGCKLFFLEAALLIEEHYDEILDEIWYVRAPQEVRIERIMDTRGYSRKKALDIISSQLSDDEFISNTDRIIENAGSESELKMKMMDIIDELTQ